MDLTFKIVRRLLRDDDVQFSRNRNFEAYEDPQVQRALRIYRHLRSIETDLLATPDGKIILDAIEREDDQMTIKLVFADQSGHRISYLTRREWLLLLECERVSGVLKTLIFRAPPATRDILRESFLAITN